MRTTLLLVTAVVLAGCERSAPPPVPSSEIGRYQITVAPTAHDMPGEGPGEANPAVWRLDTKTGALSYCHQALGVRCNSPDTPATSN